MNDPGKEDALFERENLIAEWRVRIEQQNAEIVALREEITLLRKGFDTYKQLSEDEIKRVRRECEQLNKIDAMRRERIAVLVRQVSDLRGALRVSTANQMTLDLKE